ncbi:hypothetical protein QF028_001704 [Neobacillus sp. B4I6]
MVLVKQKFKNIKVNVKLSEPGPSLKKGRVAKILLDGHLKTCVLERINEGDTEVLDEVLLAIEKLMKK